MTASEKEIRAYIREQLEDIIYILGLPISAHIVRDWAVELIKKEAEKLD